jgi:hypothetical protein
MTAPTSTTSTHKASERKFGFELECYLPSGTVGRSGSHLGTGAPIDWAPTGWGSKPDGSLTSRHSGMTAIEVISPKLAGEDGLAEVFYITESVANLGGVVDKTCGLHVHVDASDMTSEQIMAVKSTFVKFEKAFYALVGKKADERMGAFYSKNSNNWGPDTTDRYRSLNLTNILGHGHGHKTVEFRVWYSTLDAEIVLCAVYACVALVTMVMNGQATTGSRIEDYQQAVNEFCKWAYQTVDTRICPDCTCTEVARKMKAQAKLATR